VPKAGSRFAPDHLGLARLLCSSTKVLAASVEPRPSPARDGLFTSIETLGRTAKQFPDGPSASQLVLANWRRSLSLHPSPRPNGQILSKSLTVLGV
jgi:hypothetical protein